MEQRIIVSTNFLLGLLLLLPLGPVTCEMTVIAKLLSLKSP